MADKPVFRKSRKNAEKPTTKKPETTVALPEQKSAQNKQGKPLVSKRFTNINSLRF